jgi:acetyltransferase-like isoleucine patch superfamily enzyme
MKVRSTTTLVARVTFHEPFSKTQAQALIEYLETGSNLHAYEIPRVVVPLREHYGRLPAQQYWHGELYAAPEGEWEKKVAQIWQMHLPCQAVEREYWLSAGKDFFSAGGTSLMAGATVARMRSDLDLPITMQDFFAHHTVHAMASFCEALAAKKKSSVVARGFTQQPLKAPQPTMFGTLLQLVPVLVIGPYLKIVRLWIFLFAIKFFRSIDNPLQESLAGSMLIIVTAASLGRLMLYVANPCVGIFCKWLIVGVYTKGVYPVWGQMYYRWWLVEVLQGMLGTGVFEWNLPLYYWCLGAHVGRDVQISIKACIAESDLITIGDGARIGPDTTLRGFAFSDAKMVLKPVTVGRFSEVCVRAIVAPGHSVPAGGHVGPLSSSHELQDRPAEHAYDSQTFPAPMWLLRLGLGYPLLLLQLMVSWTPTLLVLAWHISASPHTEHHHIEEHVELLDRLTNVMRLQFILWMVVVSATLSPIFSFVFAVCVKRCLLGKFKEGDQQGQWASFRWWMVYRLLQLQNKRENQLLPQVLELGGYHFEATTLIYRLLGVKAGERIYWPRTGIDLVEFDLLEVGDDVVFGSRSKVLCRDHAEAWAVRLGAGSMIADRCLLLPGCNVGENCLIGSGSIGPRGYQFEAGSTWVGSRGGVPMQVPTGQSEDMSTLRPFGRAYYKGEATYFVWPSVFHMMYHTFWRAVLAVHTRLPVIVAMLLVHKVWYAKWQYIPSSSRFIVAMTFVSIAVTALQVLLLFGSDVGWGRLCLGRRTPGTYSWMDSSYIQRWIMRRSVFDAFVRGQLLLMRGTPMISAYLRSQGATIGEGACLYPTGGDPVMTEPDLVEVGAGACVDNCSLVSHTNTRGTLELHRLSVGSMATLRSHTRLSSGAKMADHAELLEHTLVLPGDEVPQGERWQGWPAMTHVAK